MHRVEASDHTMKHAAGQQPLAWDPWHEAAQQLPTNSSSKSQQLTSAQIATLETNLETKLLQKFKHNEGDADMEQSMESRVAQLEQQILQLQAQQTDNANATK